MNTCYFVPTMTQVHFQALFFILCLLFLFLLFGTSTSICSLLCIVCNCFTYRKTLRINISQTIHAIYVIYRGQKTPTKDKERARGGGQRKPYIRIISPKNEYQFEMWIEEMLYSILRRLFLFVSSYQAWFCVVLVNDCFHSLFGGLLHSFQAFAHC